MIYLDPDEGSARESHLSEVTEETVMDLVEGANFIVACPTCESEWAMSVDPFLYAGLSNSFGRAAVEGRFAALERDMPEVMCGSCLFRGEAR